MGSLSSNTDLLLKGNILYALNYRDMDSFIVYDLKVVSLVKRYFKLEFKNIL